MNDSVLAVDVGNTRTKFSILRHQSSLLLPVTIDSMIWLRDHNNSMASLESFVQPHRSHLRGCMVAGSQYEWMQRIIDSWPAELPAPRVIQSADNLPIPLKVNTPERVGVDRALNAIAACREKPGCPLIVIDSGTATTIDAVSEQGEFLGGAILPGYELSAHALHDYTSKLPLIPLEKILQAKPIVIGKQTEEALQSGLLWGQVGAINEIVSRMQNELQQGNYLFVTVFMTGGASELLIPYLNFPTIDRPQLTLQGLASLFFNK